MRRTEQLQGLRLMKFEEVYGRSFRGELSQLEAAEILGMSELGDDEADTGIQFARMPFHLSHHPPLPVPASSLIAEAGMEAQNVVRRATDRSRQQVGDALLQNRVSRQTDRVQEALGFEVFVKLWQGERGIPSEVAA